MDYIFFMKKILFPLVCLALLCSYHLSAQEESSACSVRHYSAHNQTTFFNAGIDMRPMPIGTPSWPVTVEEYCRFLNDMAPADHGWGGSVYYESAFMNNDYDLWTAPNKCIYRTGNAPHYQYTVISGHENDIIDAVTRDTNPLYNYIPSQFEEWRMTL